MSVMMIAESAGSDDYMVMATLAEQASTLNAAILAMINSVCFDGQQ